MKTLLKRTGYFLLALVVLYLLLLIPDPAKRVPVVTGGKTPFAWNRDAQWSQMEERFRNARRMDTAARSEAIRLQESIAQQDLILLESGNPGPADSSWKKMENDFFQLASLVAADPAYTKRLLDYYNRVRALVKKRSRDWNIGDPAVRNTIYMLLYGMRAATEEILLQADPQNYSPALYVTDEPSVTPTASIFGITVHSGDLLVSRGGAEVSALISRGNDYPGNFSHVALIYVDAQTKQAWLVEAHIEKGVAVATVAQYENDKKLRFMVMRPGHDLAMLATDPLLPQKAAKAMFEEAGKRHIPYDFKMNFYDSSALFCSEVASYAYRLYGMQLWKYPSSISSPGVVNWLSDFGVEHFITQMPADLEYDPQLSVVAEWRDPETLFKDHVDNAVMDALLEKADAGEQIGYNHWQLPVARVLKAYSMLKNLFGRTGIIPEGMSATRALKNQYFVAMHARVKNRTLQKAEIFREKNQYRAPYWQLLQFAREAANDK